MRTQTGHRRPTRTAFQVAAVAVTVVVVCLGVVLFARRHGFFDLHMYRSSIRWWLDGHSLYSYTHPRFGIGFTYPPFAALCLLPLALVTLPVAAVVLSLLTVAAVAVTTWWLVAPLAQRHGWPQWFVVGLAVPVVCALEPIRETVGFGQVNMLLVALVLGDVAALRAGRSWAGVGIGLATAVKLTPGLFVVYLLLTGRRREAAVATGTVLGATLVGALVAPAASWRYWTRTIWETSRVGSPDKTSNQSLLGFLARLADPAPPDRRLWFLLSCLVLAAVLWRAVRAYRQGDELVGITLTGVGTCLASPISWSHHLYWVVPAVVVLVDTAAERPLGTAAERPVGTAAGRRRALAATGAAVVVAVFASSLIWHHESTAGAHWSSGLPGVLVENAYVLVLLALAALLPARTLAVPHGRE
jgi:alpha-1,2-mannosyltransferase